MIKKTIKYEGFDGVTYTEDFYFNLNKAELAELELTANGNEGLHALLKRIVASNDNQQILSTFRTILKKAYGRRSEDGKSFIKREEHWEAFEGSNAYGELFMELIGNAAAAAEFIKGVVPSALGALVDTEDLDAMARRDMKAAKNRHDDSKSLQDWTREELLALPADEFQKLFETAKKGSIPKVFLQVALQRDDS